MEIQIEPDEEADDEFNTNLAEVLPDAVLQEIAGDLISDFDDDVGSRKDWMQTYVDGLELLGMKIDHDVRDSIECHFGRSIPRVL